MKPGNWRVSKLVIESMPVWKKVLPGKVIKAVAHNRQGNKLKLSWGEEIHSAVSEMPAICGGI